MKKLIQFIRDEEGVTAIEYSLIGALIAVVMIVAVTAAGTEVKRMFEKVEAELVKANP
jgi:pilus assembly protein Flp/PilA